MALSKRTYVGGTTKITATNLNEIQDSIIALEDKGITKDEIITALGYTPAKNGDISGALPLSGGTMSGAIDMNGKDLSNIGYATFILNEETEGISFNPTGSVENPVLEIMGTNGDEPTILRGLATPENGNDCATKDYVDENIPAIPTSLKNPKALKFTGASTGTYDGSSEVTINIPTSSGGSSITVDSALSSTSTNPVQNKVIKAELDQKLPLSGGTLTGNLTGKYLTGTWLQTTATSELSSAPEKIAVLDSSGWVYYRTLTHLKSDLGVESLPTVTTSDNGKFLMVVNGAWTASTIPSAEEVSF